MTEHQRVITEVAVAGGGMVGAALACGLAQQGFDVTVIDSRMPPEFDAGQPPDLRISAIGVASVDLLRTLAVWPLVASMRAYPYNRLETWEWESARLTFDADSLGLPVLGYMVENNVLQRALWQRLDQLRVKVLAPASVAQLSRHEPGWLLTLADGSQLQARLVIAADGANSRVRQLAGIGIQGWQYAQSCMLINVKCEQSPGMATWQQFTPEGPRALLPLSDNWASLVWYDAPARLRQLQAMTMPQLAKEIQQAFPARLGKVTPQAAGSFPLVRRHARRYVLPGLALVGDAAHTINPLAGQGVNLGYRDVNALIEVLCDARDCAEHWDSESVLKRYERRRRYDNLLMQTSMDLFYLAFSNRSAPLRVARNLGLLAAGHSGMLKRQALKYALGL
ncbi:2-octaprenyl-3-methyl-6-methoxy-1,4-benzoquinol hydroxylase [Erwinia sp. OLTSP20]|uniref:3-demethoxyubiquinol 3-hydroxylase n=1 Tax=unclassified Erwinia TaxID=2622719 RepID=UPI000C1985FC|nr:MULTISPECIES: 3-demethoxyubiquinol 3-hydroxylase [unclassified Erwinia]PIJ48784.1 2-octaprenyl-3-methyl-6-methoxy-1,4-benzoquinol hydroxylase [Erwinia sp. OAMSP11]PIJ69408.1 2-octaprenyl-3-methyl-6-methoxy-1,4-benzoquinol hydroxylase [Erwinia sp. OLSSP12]PIJ79242.1 2-octaprenyl-3-methyl-6-methoxy-1,4-benzoquinol hydroxylase [Erwinia sp. OLCASP19]PIJ80768.1 2-octaprenyl-3-methyl-6-methoxy-1,4-benzoquinol hydroxylase [Erwinia sp. OLMTSP26]PIJ82919.1 2-octaprenyl-3-methyl-6-methoxy-1,4-benzoqu